jgi:hypothetical protein
MRETFYCLRNGEFLIFESERIFTELMFIVLCAVRGEILLIGLLAEREKFVLVFEGEKMEF